MLAGTFQDPKKAKIVAVCDMIEVIGYSRGPYVAKPTERRYNLQLTRSNTMEVVPP